MNKYDVLAWCIPVTGGLMCPLVMLFHNDLFLSFAIIVISLSLSFAIHIILKMHKIKYEDLERAKKCIRLEIGFLMLDKEGFTISVINRESKLHMIDLMKRCFSDYYEKYSIYTSMGEIKAVVRIYGDIAYIDEMDFVSNVNYEEFLNVS